MYAFERIPQKPELTKFRLLLNYDVYLTAFIPRRIVDRGTVNSLSELLVYIRKRAEMESR
jgi:hypothetical protein